jgi:hypothetical protein
MPCNLCLLPRLSRCGAAPRIVWGCRAMQPVQGLRAWQPLAGVAAGPGAAVVGLRGAPHLGHDVQLWPRRRLRLEDGAALRLPRGGLQGAGGRPSCALPSVHPAVPACLGWAGCRASSARLQAAVSAGPRAADHALRGVSCSMYIQP